MAYKDRQASSTVSDMWLTWQCDCDSSSSRPFSSAFYGNSMPFFPVMIFRLNTDISCEMLTTSSCQHFRSKIEVVPPSLIERESLFLYSCLVVYKWELKLIRCWQSTASLAAWPLHIIPPSASATFPIFICYFPLHLCLFLSPRAPLMLCVCVLPDILRCGHM